MTINPVSQFAGPLSAGDIRAALVALVNRINDALFKPYGELAVNSGTPLAVALGAANAWSILKPLVIDQYSGIALNATDGSMTIPITGTYFTFFSVAFTTAEAANTLEFAMFRGGVLIPDHLAVTWLDSATYPNTVTFGGVDPMTEGDVLDVRARCTTNADIDFTIVSSNFTVFKF